MKRFIVSLLVFCAVSLQVFAATKQPVALAAQQPTPKQQQQIKTAEAFNAQRFNHQPQMPTNSGADITVIDGGVSMPLLQAEYFMQYHGSVLAVGGPEHANDATK